MKVAGASGADNTIAGIKVMGPAGDLTIQAIRIMGANGVDQVAFSASSGPAPTGATISPPYSSSYGKGTTKSAVFTASSTDGTPSSFSWGLLDGDGYVAAGAATARATLSVNCDPGESVTSTFYCDMVVGGSTERATCTLTYTNTLGGG